MGLKPIPDVNRVIIRKTKNILFVIDNPYVYKHPRGDTYIVFGEVQIEDLSQQAKAAAAKKFKAPEAAATSVAPVAEDNCRETASFLIYYIYKFIYFGFTWILLICVGVVPAAALAFWDRSSIWTSPKTM